MEENNNLDNTQIVKVEEITLASMDLQQQRMAERLYSQLGLDPVINKVLKEYKTQLSGVDKATDRVFGPFDIKGRAESIAKVSALMTYSALHQQYTKELDQIQEQVTTVAGERDHERANYDSLVHKVADVVGGDYEELKSNYEEVVDRLSSVEHLKSQTSVLNKEKSELVQKYESQIAGQQKEKADLVARYEGELGSLREEYRTAADDLRSQVAERGKRIETIEGEKAAVTSERDDLAGQLEELKKAHAELESRHSALTADQQKLRAAAAGLESSIPFDEIRKRLGPEMHTFVLKDSKVPDSVIDGVGKFLDFKKYLSHAVETGAREAGKKAVELLAAS